MQRAAHNTLRKAGTTRRAAVARLEHHGRVAKVIEVTVNRECALLRSILRMAVAWDALTKLPVFKMTREAGKQRYLTVEEVVRLLYACPESRNKLLLPMVTVDSQTGLGKGELLGLTWEQMISAAT